MTLRRSSNYIWCAVGAGCGVLCALGLVSPANAWRDQKVAREARAPAQDSGAETRLTRGKRLMLKDGSFQLVRSYERKGDRVRYYSVERGDWEEIPAGMVDWEATKKAEADADKADAALVSKVHTQEEATKIETVLDVDASLQVAPGVFLPGGEGMFAVEGKFVTPIPQVDSEVKKDRVNTIKRVLTPIPIVAAKQNVVIPGPKAKLRFNAQNLEFYLREAPPDAEVPSSIERSHRPGVSGPEVELIRATVKGNKRLLESVRTLFGENVGQERNTVSIQQWEVARTVYRFTLSEPLTPGEYALAEILPDGLNLFVWDFGIDGKSEIKK